MTQFGLKLFFVIFSVGVHIGAFWALPEASQSAGGDKGEAGVTVQSAGVAAVRLVEHWNAEPTIADTPVSLTEPTGTTDQPVQGEVVDTELVRLEPAKMARVLADTPTAEPFVLDSAPVAVAALIDDMHPPRPETEISMARPAFSSLAEASVPRRLAAPGADRVPEEPLEATAVLASIRPVPRPARQSTSTRAKGRSETSLAGLGRTRAAASGMSAAQRQALEAEWASAITRRIQKAQRYPAGRHGDGRVRVAMVIARSGQLEQVQVVASSGSSALDQAAIAAVRRAAPFPAAPPGLDKNRYPASQWLAFQRR